MTNSNKQNVLVAQTLTMKVSQESTCQPYSKLMKLPGGPQQKHVHLNFKEMNGRTARKKH